MTEHGPVGPISAGVKHRNETEYNKVIDNDTSKYWWTGLMLFKLKVNRNTVFTDAWKVVFCHNII